MENVAVVINKIKPLSWLQSPAINLQIYNKIFELIALFSCPHRLVTNQMRLGETSRIVVRRFKRRRGNGFKIAGIIDRKANLKKKCEPFYDLDLRPFLTLEVAVPLGLRVGQSDAKPVSSGISDFEFSVFANHRFISTTYTNLFGDADLSLFKMQVCMQLPNNPSQ